MSRLIYIVVHDEQPGAGRCQALGRLVVVDYDAQVGVSSVAVELFKRVMSLARRTIPRPQYSRCVCLVGYAVDHLVLAAPHTERAWGLFFISDPSVLSSDWGRVLHESSVLPDPSLTMPQHRFSQPTRARLSQPTPRPPCRHIVCTSNQSHG
jgi:hypothetical protein